MIISIDYDDTYTRDPTLWDTFILAALKRGHTVWCVSARHNEGPMQDVRDSIGRIIGHKRCVGTNGVAKRDHLFKVHGVYADVWIDDMPNTVTDGYEIGDAGLWVTQYDGSKR